MTITGTTAVAALTPDGKIVGMEIHPEDAGLPVHPLRDIMGGTPAENGIAFAALLDGAKNAYRDAVLLNAASALLVAGKAADLKEGTAMAIESIDSGAAKRAIEALARVTSAA
jgi:anthranilate phosphoribosyltransferase